MNIPAHYPDPNVPELNLHTEDFDSDLPPHIPLIEGLGECLVRDSGQPADAIMRRAVREGGEWKLDCAFSISMFSPPGSGGDNVVVVEKKTDDGPLRDYYQCNVDECPMYAARLMESRPKSNPGEQWFVSVVNDPELARAFEENGVGPNSRRFCNDVDPIPPELTSYGMPDSVEQCNTPAGDLFEIELSYD